MTNLTSVKYRDSCIFIFRRVNSSRFDNLKTLIVSCHAISHSCHGFGSNVPRNRHALYLDILYESTKRQKKAKPQKFLRVLLRAQNNYYPLRIDNARRRRQI